MIVRLLLGLAVLATVIPVGSAQARGEDSAVKKKVLEEYVQALGRLEARYNMSRGRVTETVVEKKTPKSPFPGLRPREDAQEYEFASRRPERAMVVVHLHASKLYDEIAVAYNPAYGFRLTKGKGKSGFAVHSVDPEGKTQRSLWRSYVDPYLNAPYSVYLLSTKGILASRFLKSVDVVETALDGRKCWKIVFDEPRPIARPDTSGGYEGWFIVSPEEQWVVREFQFRPKVAKSAYFGKIEYEGWSEGFPRLKRVTHSVKELAEKEPLVTTTYEFQELKFEDAPLDQFRLPFFGLPEILDPPGGVKPKAGAS